MTGNPWRHFVCVCVCVCVFVCGSIFYTSWMLTKNHHRHHHHHHHHVQEARTTQSGNETYFFYLLQNAISNVSWTFVLQVSNSMTPFTTYFHWSRSHFKILGALRVIWSNFHTEYPQILGATVQNSVVLAIRLPGFVHPCLLLPNPSLIAILQFL